MIQKISDQAQMALMKDPDHPEKVAEALGMEVVHADGWAPGQPRAGSGRQSGSDQAIAALKKGEVSQAISPAANKVVVAELTGIVPAHPAPLTK